MATITKFKKKDGSISFKSRIRLKGFPTQTATFRRKSDALKWSSRVESALREGRYFPESESSKHTLSEAIARYRRDILPNKSRTTIPRQDYQLGWWDEQLGKKKLSQIEPSLIVEYRDRLKADGKSNSTIIRYMAILSHLFTIAVREWQWMDDSPMRKVSKPKEPRGRVRFLSEEERSRLIHACQESDCPFLLPAVVVSLATGLRKSELFNLTWSNVDLGRGQIIIEDTKNKERKGLPLRGYALELFKELNKVRRIDSDLVFPSKYGKTPFTIRKPFQRALKKAGIHNFRWHDLRHSCASYLAMNGASSAEIAEVLGHKTLQMVKRYSHFSQKHVEGVIERMNAKIFG